MNFTEIVSEVLRITKRPDKILDVRREVNQAVNFFSVDSDFIQDIEELSIPIDSAEYSQAVAMSLLPRYRRMDYIRRGGTLNYLKELERAQMLTKCDLRDRWYIAGNSLKINMSALASTLDVAYYSYPPVLTDAAPDYWMLEGNWPAIVDRTVAKIFTNIGDTQSAQAHEGYARTAYLAFRKDYAQP